MQFDPRKIGYAVAMLTLILFLATILSGSKKRGTMYGLSALGLGLSKAFLQIAEKERTAR